MKEQLRKSLDTALMFQDLIDIFRNHIRDTLRKNPDINDELSLLMAISHKGLGGISVHLFNGIELLNNRISWLGNREGLEKQIPSIKHFNDGTEDFLFFSTEPQDEWHDSDASDEDELRDEWDVGEDEYDPNEPDYN